jgi:hypothetical protein
MFFLGRIALAYFGFFGGRIFFTCILENEFAIFRREVAPL